MSTLTRTIAVYRATRLLQVDTVPPLPKLRAHLDHKLGTSPAAELLECPWCLSMWVAGLSLVASWVAPRWWHALETVLVASAGAGIITQLLEDATVAANR